MKTFTKKVEKRAPLLKEKVLSSFNGGLNLVDNDLSMSPEYAKVLSNMYRHPDGSIALRYGTRLFADLATTLSGEPGISPTTKIINCTYFQDHVICVLSDGHITKTDSAGVTTLLSSPWATTAMEFCSFAVFNNILLICNGINKPLRVDLSTGTPVAYIVDPVGGTNTFTPICRYITVVDRYVVMAGDPLHVDRVYVSSVNTYTTWKTEAGGDAAPNDGTYFDTGRIASTDSQIIKGIARFRDRLVIMYERTSLLYQVGIYDTTIHKPAISDVIEQHGTLSHRCASSLGDDFYMVDYVGVPSLRRAAITGQYKPQRVSQRVDPAIQLSIAKLTALQQEDYCFTIQNDLENQFWLIIPEFTSGTQTSSKVFVYTSISELNVKAWSMFEGWNFQAGCVTELGTLIFSNGLKLFSYGNNTNPVYADFVGVPATPDGVAINFDFELPWYNFGTQIRRKISKYINLMTKGTAQFTIEAFTDFIYKKADGSYDPYAELDFTGGDTGGYGNGDQPFGGGRNTQDIRQYAFDAEFKSVKIRIKGAALGDPLKIVAIAFAYLLGGL